MKNEIFQTVDLFLYSLSGCQTTAKEVYIWTLINWTAFSYQFKEEKRDSSQIFFFIFFFFHAVYLF